MIKQPKGGKYKKAHKGHLKNKLVSRPVGLNGLQKGTLSLIALTNGRMGLNHFRMLRTFFSRALQRKRVGKVSFGVGPHTPITAKPVGIRMGKGKGKPSEYVCNVFTGATFIRMNTNVKFFRILKVRLKGIKKKLPVKVELLFSNKKYKLKTML